MQKYMYRKNLGNGMGKGYYNLVPQDPYVHSMSARGIKSFSIKKLTSRKNIEKSERNIRSIELGLGAPQLGAFTLRSISGIIGLGVDAVGLTIPAIGLVIGGGLGLVYLAEEQYLKRKMKYTKKTRNPYLKVPTPSF